MTKNIIANPYLLDIEGPSGLWNIIRGINIQIDSLILTVAMISGKSVNLSLLLWIGFCLEIH